MTITIIDYYPDHDLMTMRMMRRMINIVKSVHTTTNSVPKTQFSPEFSIRGVCFNNALLKLMNIVTFSFIAFIALNFIYMSMRVRVRRWWGECSIAGGIAVHQTTWL